MPERLRTIASRLRELVGNRRRAPRRKVRLAVFVSLLDPAPGAPPAGGVAGHTRDASGRYLVGDGVTLRLTLKLGEQSARLYGTPVRYERLDEDQDGQNGPGFLLGIRLHEDGDRAIFTEYLKGLK